MIWCSVDAAKHLSGVATWNDDELLSTCTVSPRGSKGAWYGPLRVFDCERDAWVEALRHATLVVAEEARGAFRTADQALFERLGFLRALALMQDARFERIALSEWRRVIRESCGVAWPKDSDRIKALSCQLASDLHGRRGFDPGRKGDADMAEAVLIGHAALLMGVA